MGSVGQAVTGTGGYSSEESKRRFTLIAGFLGALFFLAQIVGPIVMMLLIVKTRGFEDRTHVNRDAWVAWQDELWFVERTTKMNWNDVQHSPTTSALAHARVSDLFQTGAAIPLRTTQDWDGRRSRPTLLPVGDRLWIIEGDSASYYEQSKVTRLSGGVQPRRASEPFEYQGQPAVVTVGAASALFTLHTQGATAEWVAQGPALKLSSDAGRMRSVHGVVAGGTLFVFAEIYDEDTERWSIRYRTLDDPKWLAALEDRSWDDWRTFAVGDRPVVAFIERGQDQKKSRLVALTITPEGPQREEVGLKGNRPRNVFGYGDRLLVVSEGTRDSLALVEVANGRVTRTVDMPGARPFLERNLMLVMSLPQMVPIVLSLLLALVLTLLMRRHRVTRYEANGQARRFASLWQRAMAQLVDLVPLMAGFVLPVGWMWQMFSDPMSDQDTGIPYRLFGLLGVALAWGLLVLVVYSYLEGRFGKTPGKWLLKIRVLGADLKPCGFGRALVRNLLTFVDGFFSFLVGALLVALTENWQRLGDMAGRTVVVVDERTG